MASITRMIATIFMMGVIAIFPAEAKFLGHISNGHEPEDEQYKKEHKNEYYISCVSKVENADVFTAPDKTKPFNINGHRFEIMQGTDLSSVQMVETKGKQFLSGQIISYSRGEVYSQEKSRGYPTLWRRK